MKSRRSSVNAEQYVAKTLERDMEILCPTSRSNTPTGNRSLKLEFEIYTARDFFRWIVDHMELSGRGHSGIGAYNNHRSAFIYLAELFGYTFDDGSFSRTQARIEIRRD